MNDAHWLGVLPTMSVIIYDGIWVRGRTLKVGLIMPEYRFRMKQICLHVAEDLQPVETLMIEPKVSLVCVKTVI